MPNLNVWYWLAAGLATGVSAVGAYSWRGGRRAGSWLRSPAFSATLYLLDHAFPLPPPSLIEPRHPRGVPHLFLALGAGVRAGYRDVGLVLVRVLRSIRRPGKVNEASAVRRNGFRNSPTPGREIQVRFSQGIDRGPDVRFDVLAPNEDWAAALVMTPVPRSSPGLPTAMHPSMPLQRPKPYNHGGRCLGLRHSGARRGRPHGGPRPLIRDWNPECPPLRGVVVVFPIRWAGQPDSVKWAATVRDDLQALHLAAGPLSGLRRFTEMETAPGFAEFLGRMPEVYKQGRCGFGVPASRTFGGELIQGGLDWISGWFHGWAINLMAEDLFNQAGNQRLFGLDQEFRRYRMRLRSLIEVAFSTPPEADPPPFRGCYFAATGAFRTIGRSSGRARRTPRAGPYRTLGDLLDRPGRGGRPGPSTSRPHGRSVGGLALAPGLGVDPGPLGQALVVGRAHRSAVFWVVADPPAAVATASAGSPMRMNPAQYRGDRSRVTEPWACL